MKLAIAEIRHSKARFGAIVAALTLIVFLVLVLSAIADGLWLGSTGALRNTGASAFTFAADGRKSFIRSELTETDLNRVESIKGVREAGPVGSLLGTGRGPRGELDIAVFGVSRGKPGAPVRIVEGRSPEAGELGVGVADGSLRESGITIGDKVTFNGSSVPIEIVGFAADSRYQLQSTIWTDIETWRTIREQARPEFGDQRGRLNVIALSIEPGEDPALIAAVIDTELGNTQSLTQLDAILAIPGTAQQQSTFDTLVMATFAVAVLVIALFFALLTLEKRDLLAMTKAVGAPSRYLMAGIAMQALICGIAGFVFGATLARLAGLALPPNIPAVFLPRAQLAVAIGTVATALAGAALSFRRVSRIDPASALGGTV